MNRRAIRDLAAQDLGLKTAPYRYATSLEALREGGRSRGHALCSQTLDVPVRERVNLSSVLRRTSRPLGNTDWTVPAGDLAEMIVEAFIDFDYEITLLTLTQADGNTLFCPPIGHRQERGDYQESWQPAAMEPALLMEAERMAAEVTSALGGCGIWGVEFFIQSGQEGRARDGLLL